MQPVSYKTVIVCSFGVQMIRASSALATHSREPYQHLIHSQRVNRLLRSAVVKALLSWFLGRTKSWSQENCHSPCRLRLVKTKILSWLSNRSLNLTSAFRLSNLRLQDSHQSLSIQSRRASQKNFSSGANHHLESLTSWHLWISSSQAVTNNRMSLSLLRLSMWRPLKTV